jgi:HAD superfamily hydrolase (TIGR01509 family)
VIARALVFDFDGLILDTETPIYTSWSAIFTDHGCEPPTLEEWALEVGAQRALDPMAMLRDRSGRHVDADAVQRLRRAHRDDLLAREQVRPGVEQWLDDARRLGLAIGIASSSEHGWVESHLSRLGLRDRFSHLACYSEALRAKPEPDTYLAACAALGVTPTDALALEDSPNGIAAAKTAGLRVVAVPNGVTAGMDLEAADLVLESLASRPLAVVLDALANSRG